MNKAWRLRFTSLLLHDRHNEPSCLRFLQPQLEPTLKPTLLFFKKEKLSIFISCIWVLCLCVCKCTTWVPDANGRPEEDIRSPLTGVADDLWINVGARNWSVSSARTGSAPKRRATSPIHPPWSSWSEGLDPQARNWNEFCPSLSLFCGVFCHSLWKLSDFPHTSSKQRAL